VLCVRNSTIVTRLLNKIFEHSQKWKNVKREIFLNNMYFLNYEIIHIFMGVSKFYTKDIVLIQVFSCVYICNSIGF